MSHARELQVVYGGQYGSEGKGQVAAYLARHSTDEHFVAMRVGGPNAGHTITDRRGNTRKLQQIPCAAFVESKAKVVPIIGVSGLIVPSILKREIDWLAEAWYGMGYRPTLVIDPLATVILPEYMAAEEHLKYAIGSTGEGVGAATAARVMRYAQTWEKYVGSLDHDERNFWGKWTILGNTQEFINNCPYQGSWTLQLEGTQGYFLSLNAGRFYPFCTSRDCGPEAIVAQCGTSLRIADHTRIVCVMRTFPIRVGGNSGELFSETTWEELSLRTNGYIQPEITTVTKKIRRVGEWDPDLAARVGNETKPTEIALTFADYLHPSLSHIYETRGWEYLYEQMLAAQNSQPVADCVYTDLNEFFNNINEMMGAPVRLFSVGPGQIVDLEYYPF